MLTKSERLFAILYCIVLILEMYTAAELPILHYFTKPALLLALMIFYAIQSPHITLNQRNITFGALGASLLGDILLMFVEQSQHFFTAGLVAFLIAHLLYIIIFLKTRHQSKKPWLFSGILVIYGSSLFYLLKDHLGMMLLPVFFYMLVILTMATSAFLRKGSVKEWSYNFVLLGAILFLISDSLLAVNKFYTPLAYSNISIMFTYAFAQLFIVFGLLKQR